MLYRIDKTSRFRSHANTCGSIPNIRKTVVIDNGYRRFGETDNGTRQVGMLVHLHKRRRCAAQPVTDHLVVDQCSITSTIKPKVHPYNAQPPKISNC